MANKKVNHKDADAPDELTRWIWNTYVGVPVAGQAWGQEYENLLDRVRRMDRSSFIKGLHEGVSQAKNISEADPSPSVPSEPAAKKCAKCGRSIFFHGDSWYHTFGADVMECGEAIESNAPASKPERSGACPTCKSTDPKVRLKGLAWAANLYPERGCVIRCEDRTCRSVAPHFHAYCSNSFHSVSDDPGKGDVR